MLLDFREISSTQLATAKMERNNGRAREAQAPNTHTHTGSVASILVIN